MITHLIKSHVKAHTRRTRSGAVTTVREHDDSRTKKPQAPKDAIPKGTEVVFTPPVSTGKRPKARRGTVVGSTKNSYRIQGKRDNTGKVEVFTVDRSAVALWAPQEQAPKDARYAEGDKAHARRTLTAEESLRRKSKGMKRLKMTEDEVMNHAYVKGLIIKEAAKLAETNGIQPKVSRGGSLWHHAADPEYADVVSEFALGALGALRREAEAAPSGKIREFRDHLAGTLKTSSIFGTMIQEGRRNAVRHLQDRKAKTRDLVDIQAGEEDPDMRRHLAKMSTAPEQAKVGEETVEQGIESFLSRLPEKDAALLRMKFGLGEHDPHTNEQIAAALNASGTKYQGKYVWTRNHAGAAVAEALQKLKALGGIEELRDFLKSQRERLDLMKALRGDFPGAEIRVLRQGIAVVMTDEVLEKAHVAAHMRRNAHGTVSMVREHEDSRTKHVPATESEAFKKWFGDSKVVDDHGKPLVVYHGTQADFSEFETGRNKAEGETGIFFTPDPSVASRYTGHDEIFPADKIGSVLPVYLQVDRLKTVDFNGDKYGRKEAIAAAREEGFDGVLLKNHYDAGGVQDQYVVFSPNQIKSAIGNAGTFDPHSDDITKSFSSDLAKKYAGGRWITIKEGPLAGRHVFILPHKDGTASVLAGGGPALKHKVLGLKKEEPKEEEKKPEAKPEPAAEEKKPDEDKKQEAADRRQEIRSEIEAERKQMAEKVRQHLGKEVEITAEEKQAIEQKVAGIADPKKKAAERMKEHVRLKKEKDDLLHHVAEEAKKAILEEEPTGQGKDSLHAVVKEHAEDLLNHYYRIQALKRQDREVGKLLKNDSGKKPVPDILAFSPLSREQLEEIVTDEKARDEELKAHYRLIATTRGYVDEKGKEHKAQGGAELERNIKQGGFEALTGIVGEITGSAILRKEAYDELGPQNAAVLAHYFLKEGGHDVKGATKKLSAFIASEGGQVAKLANDRGDRFMQMAGRVREFGRGQDNLMSAFQALGTALKYQGKAFEAYGQAEGALNQGAELAYEFQADRGRLEFHGSKDALDRKRQKLKLRKGDVSVVKDGEGYKMTVPARSFERIIAETPTKKNLAGQSVEDVKNLKANTDDFRPSMMREYTPEDASGNAVRIVPKPEQQAAARLIEKQKRVYLNFEAGTGKSLAIVLAKAHIEDATGQPKKMIISMPQKLMSNFKDEVEKFSHYKVAIVDDSTPEKRRAKYAADPDTIVVVNKEKFNFDKADISRAGFDMVVADEAHTITQREGRSGSDMSKGLAEVAAKAPYYVAMSGTPTPSDLSQLYFHAHAMNPEKFSSQKEFLAKFGSAHKGVGYKEKIQNFMNRELSDHVFTVKKRLDTSFTLRRHHAELSPVQKDEYRRVSEDFRARRISPLQRDNQLNTVLNATDHRSNGKFAAIKGIVDRHMAEKGPDEKVIFYAKNYDTVNQIRDFLGTHYPGQEAVSFTGREKIRDIDANKKRFKHDPAVKFAIHTEAGTAGLNLQYDGNGGGATTAIAVASGENAYSTLDQFFSRANRTGAKKNIHGHLVLTDTPHDMGTELRLEEKKGVGELIKSDKDAMRLASRLFLLKSHVKEHTRRNKSGTVSVVKEHEDSRQKRLDHGELNVPGRTKNIDRDLDRHKKEQAAKDKAKAKTSAQETRTDKAAAKEALAKWKDAILERHGAKFGRKELASTLDGWAKWEPKKLLAFVAKFESEQKGSGHEGMSTEDVESHIQSGKWHRETVSADDFEKKLSEGWKPTGKKVVLAGKVRTHEMLRPGGKFDHIEEETRVKKEAVAAMSPRERKMYFERAKRKHRGLDD